MKRIALPLLVLLAGCNAGEDRLTDAEATREQAPNGQVIPIDQQGVSPAAGAALPSEPGEVLYRALGTEPGWALTVRRNAMLYQGDYGTVRVVEATPPGFKAGRGTTRTGRLTITVAGGPCNDGMSDHVWRDKVSVAVTGGRSVQGCGGGLIKLYALEGPRWAVTAINGRTTGESGPRYWLSFVGGEMQGSFGCNSFSARYGQNADHLDTRGLLATQMRCAEPASRFEREGLAVLGSNMRIEQEGGRTRLVSEAGSIDLAPREHEVPSA